MISELEFKILKEIKENWESIEDLAKRINEDYYKVLRICGFLKEKRLIDLEEREIEQIEITEKGEIYLDKDLPEERLIKILKERKELDLKEVFSIFSKEEASYALGYLRRNNIAEIKDGKLVLLKDIEVKNKMKNLDKLKKEELIELEKRGLIKTKLKKIYYVKINENGKKLLREYKIEEYIDSYTKDILDKEIYKTKKFRKYDIKIKVKMEKIGRYNRYLRFLDRIREELISMGFEEMEDYSIIISHFWDLDSLFIPQDHPAGDLSLMDAFYLKYPETIEDFPKELYEKVKENNKKHFKIWDDFVAKRSMLISHDTAISARTLLKAKIPGRYFLIEKVYRYDTIDAKHFIEFNQLEGIILEDGVKFSDLLGILRELAVNVVGAKDVKFYPAFFPFTEPSVEIYAKHPKLGWIEVGGAGIFREELLKPFEINVPVLAWGLGIDRLAMIYLGIEDIRDLHTRNIKRLQK